MLFSSFCVIMALAGRERSLKPKKSEGATRWRSLKVLQIAPKMLNPTHHDTPARKIVRVKHRVWISPQNIRGIGLFFLLEILYLFFEALYFILKLARVGLFLELLFASLVFPLFDPKIGCQGTT